MAEDGLLVVNREVRQEKPAKIVVAVAVSQQETAERFKAEVDEFVAVAIPEIFLGAIGHYYDDFSQTSDVEVMALLKRE